MKKVIMIVIAALIALFGSGCAGPITKEQHIAITIECNDDAICISEKENRLLEQFAYEREAKRLEERDKIRQFIAGCKEAGMIIVYQGWEASRRFGTIPRHARLADYQCASRDQIRDALRRAGLNY